MLKHTIIAIALGLFITTTTFVQEASSQVMEQIQKVTADDAASGDNFGWSVGISGDIAVVGAIKDDDVDTDSGAAYIFEKDYDELDNWGQRKKVVAPTGFRSDFFGNAVSVSGDTIIIGAYLYNDGDPNTGSAYIFERNFGGANNWGNVLKLIPSDSTEDDRFGISVAIDGDTALVGAYGKNAAATESGAAYVFNRDQGGPEAWGEVIRLIAYDAAAYDYFGVSAGVDGDIAVVGSYNDDDNGSNSGSVYVFERNRGGPDVWGNIAKLTASDGAAGDTFGETVSVSGDRIIVGAKRHGAAGVDSGAAYIFERNQEGFGAWGQVAKLVAEDAAAGDYFGSGVSISGDIAAVGAGKDDDQGEDSGSLYIFMRNQDGPNGWGQSEKHVASAGAAAAGDVFGSSVSMRNGLLIAGALYNDGEATDAGSAYIFEATGSGPGTEPALVIPIGVPTSIGNEVGVPIELSGNGEEIAGVAFSIDFDETCLDFDLTDANADEIPDAVDFHVPASFDLSVSVDLLDTDGEIEITISDATPVETLADGDLATVHFTPTCAPALGDSIIAPVLFSSDPDVSFSDLAAVSIPGSAVDGSIAISYGIRGDCNDDGVVDVADMIGCELEIFDGDGDFWLDTPGGTFPGNPIGCDSNADTTVDAGDISCTTRLIFGHTCPGFRAYRSWLRPPRLELASRLDEMNPGVVVARIHFSPGDHYINTVVFSLDINEDVLRFDNSDMDGDGTPDAVRFSGVQVSSKSVNFDPADNSGELDFLISDRKRHPRIIEAGVLVEIEFQLMGPVRFLDDALFFSREVRPSFGSRLGSGVLGDVYVDRPMY